MPTLADRGEYIASESSFYRVLHEEGQMQHRERARPRTSTKPKEHIARAPNQVWCWDITYLRSSVRGVFFYLYLIVDIYSRKIVGWWVAAEESMDIAADLIERATREQHVPSDTLVLHADNGGPMKGSTMLATLHRLGVLASFSRPRVSDDNPYAEALFRTLKYDAAIAIYRRSLEVGVDRTSSPSLYLRIGRAELKAKGIRDRQPSNIRFERFQFGPEAERCSWLRVLDSRVRSTKVLASSARGALSTGG